MVDVERAPGFRLLTDSQWIVDQEVYIYNIYIYTGISNITKKHGFPIVAPPKESDTMDLNQQVPDLVNKWSHLGLPLAGF